MSRMDRRDLERALAHLDVLCPGPVELTLVGGAAVALLVPDTRVTFDLDAMAGPGLPGLLAALAEHDAADERPPLSTRSDAFELFLPPDWRERRIVHHLSGLRRLTVLTPAPEDLAVMKLFRFHAKDADDIARLSQRPGFDRERLRTAFETTLPGALGDPAWHRQSFQMIWERVFGPGR